MTQLFCIPGKVPETSDPADALSSAGSSACLLVFQNFIDCRLDLICDIHGENLLADDQIKDFTALFLVEESERILHKLGSVLLNDGLGSGICKAFFDCEIFEIHNYSPYLKFCWIKSGNNYTINQMIIQQ